MLVALRSISFFTALTLVVFIGIPVLSSPIDPENRRVDVIQKLVPGNPIALITDQPAKNMNAVILDASVQAMIATLRKNARERYMMEKLVSHTWWPADDNAHIKLSWLLAINQGTASINLATAQLDSITSEDYIAIWGAQQNIVGQHEIPTMPHQPIWSDGTSPGEPRLFATLRLTQRS